MPEEEVTELTMDSVGAWAVVTKNSVHYFDMDRKTVRRARGSNASPSVNDVVRPLRTIEQCRVGEGGHWTMKTDEWSNDIDYFWHFSTPIRRIERWDPAQDTTAAGESNE